MIDLQHRIMHIYRKRQTLNAKIGKPSTLYLTLLIPLIYYVTIVPNTYLGKLNCIKFLILKKFLFQIKLKILKAFVYFKCKKLTKRRIALDI